VDDTETYDGAEPAEVLEVRVRGELDSATLSRIADDVARALRAGGDVILDVSEATLAGARADAVVGAHTLPG
jgi:anti-anti-sigma regulatory factor